MVNVAFAATDTPMLESAEVKAVCPGCKIAMVVVERVPILFPRGMVQVTYCCESWALKQRGGWGTQNKSRTTRSSETRLFIQADVR